MMSSSGGLKPKAVAGGPSVTRFTHSSCTGTMTADGTQHNTTQNGPCQQIQPREQLTEITGKTAIDDTVTAVCVCEAEQQTTQHTTHSQGIPARR